MKTRTFIILLLLLILAIILGLSAFEAITLPQNTPDKIPTPVVTSTSDTTPTPIATATPTPTLKDKITDIESTIFDPIIAALNFLSVVLIAVLIIVVLKLVWDYSGKSNLVIDAFINATGDDTLDKVEPGLNQLTRMLLAEELEKVRDDINAYIDPGLEQISETPPPERSSNEQLSNLLKSLTDVSSGTTKTAVQLLGLVFGPSGTRIVTTLHRLGDFSGNGKLGIGLEVMDLQGRNEPASLNFFEKENDNSPQVRRPIVANHILEEILNLVQRNPQDNKQTEPEQALEQRYFKLVAPAARWLSVELAFRSMERSGHSIRHFLKSIWMSISFQNIIARFKKSGEWESTYQARLYNFIGYYHLNNAEDFSAYGYSYDLAVEAFKKAAIADKYQVIPKIWVLSRPWYRPYENLGLAYLNRALEKIKQSSPLLLTDDGIDDIYQALSSLRQAKELFDQHKKKQPVSSDKLVELNQFLILLTCIVRLLSANYLLILESIDDTLDLIREGDLDNTMDCKINFRILYNLACWYGLVYRIGFNARDTRLVNAQQRARHIIVRSLARNVDFWYTAANDPCLTAIAEAQDWDNLKIILERIQFSFPDLSKKEGDEFAKGIDDILQQLEWQ